MVPYPLLPLLPLPLNQIQFKLQGTLQATFVSRKLKAVWDTQST
jgi:hypothetical protein